MRLTDADNKWMLTAEYGGSGGKPIETGLVVEEPDIEIGAGVSSKGNYSAVLSSGPLVRLSHGTLNFAVLIDSSLLIARPKPSRFPCIYHMRLSSRVTLTHSSAISRRMATDRGGYAGPRSSRDGTFNPNNIQTNNSRFRQPDRDNGAPNNNTNNISPNNNNMIGVPPAIPSFGFQFPNFPNGES